MLAELDDYDWENAFSAAAGEYRGSTGWSGVPDVVPGSSAFPGSFEREDVAAIHGIAIGENDGAEWLLCGQLNDGRFFYLTAGCDYTGWDCRSSGRSYVAASLAELAIVITADERERLSTGEVCMLHDDCMMNHALARSCALQRQGDGQENG